MTERERGVVIAIDGPAGAGKSTVSRRMADRLGYTLVDTGAMYRSVAYAAIERGLSLDDAAAMGELSRTLDLAFEGRPNGSVRVFVDGRDVSDAIRDPRISTASSRVSRHPAVRDALVEQQRRLGAAGGVVLEGRDIGTVVFPDAEVKVFLTASPEERARRRVAELVAKGHDVEYADTLAQILERDALDEGREVAPLKPAADALLLDSTDLGLDEVVERICAKVRSVRAAR